MTAAELATACRNLTAADDTVRAHTEARSDHGGWYVVVPADDLDALHRCVQQATEAAR
jgi:hypothetical protein